MNGEIAIIEDNPELLEFVAEIVKTKLEMLPRKFTSGAKALNHLKLSKPELVLIDLQLEDIRGETICQELRQQYADLPIIILTGETSTASIVNCLNSGADDYITKPFDINELLARIRARLRAVVRSNAPKVLTAQGVSLDQDLLEVRHNDQVVELTAKEFELLRYLMMHKGMVLTREKILVAVWGYPHITDTRVVDVHIGKLRRKLNQTEADSTIRTVRGFGYKVVD